MQALYSPGAYPPDARAEVERLGALAVEIANRWMLGWPKRVKGLLASGEYLEALRTQHETEAMVLSHEASLRHLARHEIAELYGLSLSPPWPTEDDET